MTKTLEISEYSQFQAKVYKPDNSYVREPSEDPIRILDHARKFIDDTRRQNSASTVELPKWVYEEARDDILEAEIHDSSNVVKLSTIPIRVPNEDVAPDLSSEVIEPHKNSRFQNIVRSLGALVPSARHSTGGMHNTEKPLRSSFYLSDDTLLSLSSRFDLTALDMNVPEIKSEDNACIKDNSSNIPFRAQPLKTIEDATTYTRLLRSATSSRSAVTTDNIKEQQQQKAASVPTTLQRHLSDPSQLLHSSSPGSKIQEEGRGIHFRRRKSVSRLRPTTTGGLVRNSDDAEATRNYIHYTEIAPPTRPTTARLDRQFEPLEQRKSYLQYTHNATSISQTFKVFMRNVVSTSGVDKKADVSDLRSNHMQATSPKSLTRTVTGKFDRRGDLSEQKDRDMLYSRSASPGLRAPKGYMQNALSISGKFQEFPTMDNNSFSNSPKASRR